MQQIEGKKSHKEKLRRKQFCHFLNLML